MPMKSPKLIGQAHEKNVQNDSNVSFMTVVCGLDVVQIQFPGPMHEMAELVFTHGFSKTLLRR